MSSATAGRLLRACALASTSFRPAGEHPHRADALTSRQSVAVRRPAAVRQRPRSARLDAARLSSTTAHSTTAPQSCQERVGFHASVVGTGAGCASVFCARSRRGLARARLGRRHIRRRSRAAGRRSCAAPPANDSPGALATMAASTRSSCECLQRARVRPIRTRALIPVHMAALVFLRRPSAPTRRAKLDTPATQHAACIPESRLLPSAGPWS